MIMEPRQEICDAIINKRKIKFTYNGVERIGEPQCYGINTRNNEAIRMYQKSGSSRPEELLLVSQMKSYTILDEHFTSPGPNYRKDDKAMKKIFAQL
jgi:hypothetical protein